MMFKVYWMHLTMLSLINILGNNDEPDAEGIRLQKIYDEIMAQNWD